MGVSWPTYRRDQRPKASAKSERRALITCCVDWLTLWLNSEAHPICIQLFSDIKYRSSYSLHHETASQSDHVIYHSVEVRRDFRASAACSHTVVSPYSWKRSESGGKLFWNSGLSNWQTTFIVLLIISVVLRCANTAVSTIHQVSATCGNECQRSSFTTTLINKSIVNWSSLLHPPLSHSKDSKDDPLVQPQNETANQGIIQGSSTFDCKIIKKKQTSSIDREKSNWSRNSRWLNSNSNKSPVPGVHAQCPVPLAGHELQLAILLPLTSASSTASPSAKISDFEHHHLCLNQSSILLQCPLQEMLLDGMNDWVVVVGWLVVWLIVIF